MPQFQFAAVDSSGRIKQGTTEAATEAEAVARIERHGLKLKTISAESPVPTSSKPASNGPPQPLDRIAPPKSPSLGPAEQSDTDSEHPLPSVGASSNRIQTRSTPQGGRQSKLVPLAVLLLLGIVAACSVAGLLLQISSQNQAAAERSDLQAERKQQQAERSDLQAERKQQQADRDERKDAAKWSVSRAKREMEWAQKKADDADKKYQDAFHKSTEILTQKMSLPDKTDEDRARRERLDREYESADKQSDEAEAAKHVAERAKLEAERHYEVICATAGISP